MELKKNRNNQKIGTIEVTDCINERIAEINVSHVMR